VDAADAKRASERASDRENDIEFEHIDFDSPKKP
jgi:hypothetical protein